MIWIYQIKKNKFFNLKNFIYLQKIKNNIKIQKLIHYTSYLETLYKF